jgi:serine phosphatase RsbU (regulator of sigma subunit)
VLIFSVFSYIKNREKELLETNKILEDKVQKRTAEVVQKNRELEQVNIEVHEQKAIIEEKNKDIIDSIMYAKRIQEAILPNLKQAHALMDPFFVLYKPKDIVSGDLYWIEAVEEKVLFAAMDCTGHGVPGALVSIVAHNSLNRAVKELNIKTPSLILDKLNDFVEETFSKSESAVNDGLDIALCLLDRKNNILEFAAAYNPLYQIRKGALTVIKADKQPIGKFAERTPFTNHIIETQAGDGYYIFSDGYADQFGGPKGKKFKYAQFEQLLLSIYTLPMQQQLEILNKTMDEWKGPLEQIDDICVFGFRV